jgi:hypothetical protein
LIRSSADHTNTEKCAWAASSILEQLKAVHIVVKKDEGIQVLRKLTDLDSETRTLVEVFNMTENEKFPEVDTEKFK